MKKNTTNKFLIGSWVSFYSFDVDSYEYQLDQMREAGLNFNIFPAVFGGGMQNAEVWENVERQYEARDMYYCMNGGLDEHMLKEGVTYAKGKARCIGYHLIDEPGGGALPNVGRFVRAYREADSTRYPFVNLFPSYVGNAAMEGDYYQYCSRFVREAGAENIEYLSHDFYPFHLNGTAMSIFGDMEVIRLVALENGRLRTHAFPQSTAWMGTRMPNIDEMRWNVYAYLAYGFKALSWFNLVCPGKSDTEGECFRESIIYRDGQIHDQQLFMDFGKLNAEVHAIGDTLMKLDTLHAYHTRKDIAGVETLPADWMITPAGDQHFVISHMVTGKGDETYVMIFNMSFKDAVTASFAIDAHSGIESLEYVSPFTGEHEPAEIADGVLTAAFRPGEGRLYRVNGKLSRLVLPCKVGESRLCVDLPAPADIIGLDVALSKDVTLSAAELQISSNKKFTEGRTVTVDCDIPQGGEIRTEPVRGKYLRLNICAEAAGYAELRVRFADEALTTVNNTSVTIEEAAPVVIPMGATADEVAALLPKTLNATFADGKTMLVTPVWDIGGLDTTVSGIRRLTASLLLADGTPVSDEFTASLQVTVTYSVDLTALEEAISVVEELNEEEYSPESWKLVRDYYDAAVAMRDGSYSQNAVTVAAWQLLDRVRELVPVMWTPPVTTAPEENHNSIRVDKGILPAAVATLAGAVAGALTAFFTVKAKKKKK